jgi:tetratricopeptide (TPR) repeat protein
VPKVAPVADLQTAKLTLAREPTMDQPNRPAASTPNSRKSAGTEAGTRSGASGVARDDGEAASVGALVAAAQATMAQRGAADALPLWQEIRERFPDLPVGHVGHGVALMEVGRPEEAEGLLAESIKKFPDDLWARIHYAQLAARRGNWTEALRRCQELRNRFPENVAGDVGYFGTAAAIQQYCARLTLSLPGAFEIQKRCLELLRLLAPNRVQGFHKARFGSAHDGGYVMIVDFTGVAAAFSFGIANDANWDADVANHGVPVYQFDHTIDAPPISRRDLIFTKARIVAVPAQGAQTIDELVERYGSPGKASLILKIDIEGDEWDVFDSASETALSCFAQIVGEFHFLGYIMTDSRFYEKALRVFKKLTRTFGVVHVHATNSHNGHSVGNVMVPYLLEITFANRHRYSLAATDEIFPGPLDAPNNPNSPDIYLGRFIY